VAKIPKKPGLGAKKNGKPGESKPSGPVKKGKAVARSKMAAKMQAKPKPKPKRRRPSRARPPRGKIPFICSECYEDFVLPTTYSKDTVTCPECLHVGKRPDDNFLETVTLHKEGEKKAFSKALYFGQMLAFASLVFMWAISPYSLERFKGHEDFRGYFIMGLGAACLILVGLLTWSVNKYESNRWEVYF